MIKKWALTLLFFSLICQPLQAQWAFKQAPLMTRWASELDPAHPLPEYPRPQMVRSQWQNLNGLWQFEEATSDEVPFSNMLSDTILVPFPVESALSGVMRAVDKVWYKRTFVLPAAWDEQRILLHFGAVDWHCKVWLNGVFLGEHKGGYNPFSFEITDVVQPYNELIVWVYDPTDEGEQPVGKQLENPHSIWFSAVTGIWQTVWIEVVPQVYITHLRITPDFDQDKVLVNVALNDSLANSTIRAKVFDGETLVGEAYRYGGGPLEINIPNPKYWSPEDPFLYDLQLIVQNISALKDTVRSYFGLRKISLGKDENGHARIFLNNKPYFQLGPLDQGYWPDGLYTAPSDEALLFDIEYAQKLGYNMIRKHVKVEPDRWYYWCDKLGMLVWQDMPNGKNNSLSAKEQFKQELTGMINNLYNHPSIVQWVIFNENWGQFDIPEMVNLVRSLDGTRLINANSGWNVGGTDTGAGDVNDIHHYQEPQAPEPEADRAVLCGEFGGLWMQVEGHTWGEFTGDGFQDSNNMINAYSALMSMVQDLIKTKALSAAVYTEITDVEKEYAGWLTYDREVEKCNYLPIYFANRNTIATALEDREVQPKGFRLEQNFPNPFNSTTMIRFQLPVRSFVQLAVYDVLGQKIKTLVHGLQAPGTHHVQVQAEQWPSGVYFYTLSGNDQHWTKKMILLR